MDTINSFLAFYAELPITTKILFGFIGFWAVATVLFFSVLIIASLTGRISSAEVAYICQPSHPRGAPIQRDVSIRDQEHNTPEFMRHTVYGSHEYMVLHDRPPVPGMDRMP